jgi:hypothetical protein
VHFSNDATSYSYLELVKNDDIIGTADQLCPPLKAVNFSFTNTSIRKLLSYLTADIFYFRLVLSNQVLDLWWHTFQAQCFFRLFDEFNGCFCRMPQLNLRISYHGFNSATNNRLLSLHYQELVWSKDFINLLDLSIVLALTADIFVCWLLISWIITMMIVCLILDLLY